MECKYCNSLRKNHNSLINHERLCKLNPERQFTTFSDNEFQKHKNGKVGNQYTKAKLLGLPKPILSESTKQKFKIISANRKHSTETKIKISLCMKKAHKDNRAGRLKPYKKYQILNVDSCNLYIIKIHDENCIKVGITEKNIIERFKKDKFKYDIIFIKNSDGLSVSLLEEKIKNKYKNKRYITKEKFSGHTECYDLSMLNNILYDLS